MPTPEQIDKALALIGKGFANYAYFFAKLEDPSWLVPLRDKGLFSKTPPARSGQRWPQAEYLAKMAKREDRQTQETVLDIILKVETDNEFMHWHFSEAALAMPPDLALKWSLHESQWIGNDRQLFGPFPETLGNLASKLAKSGHVDPAFDLMAKVLAVLRNPDDEKEPKTPGEEIAYSSREPRIRCDRYHYERVLERNVPDLVAASADRSLALLCNLLSKAIAYSRRRGEERHPHDYSQIWRPAIEDHPQNHNYSIQDPLITSVRNTAESICRSQPQRTPGIVAYLEKREWNVFGRIALHLLRVLPDVPIEQIEQRLTTYAMFEETTFRHEYFHLAEDRFGLVSQDGQKTVLRWIEEAKDLKEYLATREEDWTPELKERRVRYWQYERLWPIRRCLLGEWKQRFDELRGEFGEPEHPDFTSYHMSFVGGPDSPKSIQELEAMTVPEIVKLLQEWKPTGKWRDPTPNSLGLALREVVTGKPQRFTDEIQRFIGQNLDPTYIRNLITGFLQAMEKDAKLDYSALFKLCQWVVDQQRAPEREIPGSLRADLEIDLDWGPARHEIAGCLEKVFNEKIGLPSNFRETVWAIIEPLTRDPDPDSEYEAKYGGKNMDPLTMSINTIRGKSLHSVVHYALWVCRDIDTREKRRPTFADMPEVRAVLEEHLDVTRDPTQTSRAIYGQWLPQLGYIDKDWVSANLTKIFPVEEELRPLRNAAWHTYLMFSGRILFDLLGEVYRQEVERLSGRETDDDEYGTPEIRLADHLMILCAWGTIGTEKGGLVDTFFRKANHKLTAKALDFVGRDLHGEKTLEPEYVERFKALWDWRLEMAGGIDKTPRDDLASFGWWFASGKCGDAWAFERLEKVLERTDIPHPNMFVFNYMAGVSKDYPKQSLRCLRLFIDRNRDEWFFGRKKEAVWNILASALAMEDPAIKGEAESLVHLLGSKGYLQYRELLSKK